jgi:hypothetical protein
LQTARVRSIWKSGVPFISTVFITLILILNILLFMIVPDTLPPFAT